MATTVLPPLNVTSTEKEVSSTETRRKFRGREYKYRVVGDGTFEFYVDDGMLMRAPQPRQVLKMLWPVSKALAGQLCGRLLKQQQLSYRITGDGVEWYLDGRYLVTTEGHRILASELRDALSKHCKTWWIAESVWRDRSRMHEARQSTLVS